MPRKPKLVRVLIKRKDGIIQHIRVRGQYYARTHPRRVNKKGIYQNTGPFYNDSKPLPPKSARLRQQQRAPRRAAERRPAPPTPAPDVATSKRQTAPLVETAQARKGAKYSTWFKALGTIGSVAEMKGSGQSPDLLQEALEDEAAPAAFYSNQSLLLGQVKFPGIVPLGTLIDRLNDALQFSGEMRPGFDFRDAYRDWEYRYQVVETLGPTERIIDYKADHS